MLISLHRTFLYTCLTDIQHLKLTFIKGLSSL